MWSSVEDRAAAESLFNLVTLVIHAFAALLVGVIQIVILGIGVVIVKILVILGPFVFAVSMLPVFQKQSERLVGLADYLQFLFHPRRYRFRTYPNLSRKTGRTCLLGSVVSRSCPPDGIERCRIINLPHRHRLGKQ